MDLHDQLKPIQSEAARTGVPCLPEWLYQGTSTGYWRTEDAPGGDQYISDDAARMIAEAGIGKFLAERGIGLMKLDTVWYDWRNAYVGLIPLPSADYLSALIAAATKVYAAMHDARDGEGGA